jgi:SAM-dependent methyltransferase
MKRDEWDARYAAVELVWSAGPNQFLEIEAAGLPPGRALDVACGEGRNALWLAQQGWQVTAADFSAVAIDKGRARAADLGLDVDFQVADVVAWSPPAQAFDLVIVFYLQLPAADRAAAFAKAAGAVAPGGTLLIVGHDSTNIAEGYGGPQDPAVLYGPEDVTADIAGLDVEKAERVERHVDTADGPRTAIDLLVRAVRPR